MSTRMFRQVSLERLSSPEQLDRILHVTSPRDWVALVAVFLLLASAIIWGYVGTVVTTASGRGVIVRTGGVLNVVTQGGGLVVNLNVGVSENVKAHQVVATVAQPVLAEKMKATRQALAEAQDERQRALQVRRDSARLQIEALDRQRANTEREIIEMDEQVKIVTEQISAEEQLLLKGLVTRQQVLAAREKLINIQDKISTARAQLKQFDAQRFAIQSQPAEEDTQRRLRISNLQRDLAGMDKELSLAENVISPYSGQVTELKVAAGSTVSMGQPILSIQPDAQNLELLAYVSSAEAKETKVGMEVQVSPSTVKREEYGFIKAAVVYVSDYPATPAALMRNFQNESLTQALTGIGPVTEVRIALKTDSASPSGFQWSARQSPNVVITSGTICNIGIVTRRQRPITLVFPYLKEKFGLN